MFNSNSNNNNNNNNNVTVLCNKELRTDREVMSNGLDIIIKNKKDKTCILIDVTILADKNVTQEVAEKEIT